MTDSAGDKPDMSGADMSGQTATVWHEGSQSFYEAKLIRRANPREFLKEALTLSAEKSTMVPTLVPRAPHCAPPD